MVLKCAYTSLLLAYPELVRSIHHGNAEEQQHPNAGSSLNEVPIALLDFIDDTDFRYKLTV